MQLVATREPESGIRTLLRLIAALYLVSRFAIPFSPPSPAIPPCCNPVYPSWSRNQIPSAGPSLHLPLPCLLHSTPTFLTRPDTLYRAPPSPTTFGSFANYETQLRA